MHPGLQPSLEPDTQNITYVSLGTIPQSIRGEGGGREGSLFKAHVGITERYRASKQKPSWEGVVLQTPHFSIYTVTRSSHFEFCALQPY